MGLGVGPKTNYKLIDKLRALVLLDCVVSLDSRETESKGMKFCGLSIDSMGEVAT